MTVGIAAACESGSDEPKIVLSADRLVTTGLAARIEYEHTSSKMVELRTADDITAMGIAAGSMSLADDVFYKLGNYISENDPHDVRSMVEDGVESFQDLVQESIERQVLRPNGFTLSSFNAAQNQLNPQIAQGIYQDILQKQEEIKNGLNALIAGVDSSGSHIYSIRNGDMARFDTIGYHCVGMGAEPANSSFIRSRYNDTCSINEALLSVVEAKMHAERAQGVGREMDIVVIGQDEKIEVDQDEIKRLRSIQEEIEEEQANIRDDIVEEKDYNFEA